MIIPNGAQIHQKWSQNLTKINPKLKKWFPWGGFGGHGAQGRLEGPRTVSNLATEVTPARPRRPNIFLVQGSTFDELLSSQKNPSGDGDDNASDAGTLLTLGSDFDIADAPKVAQKILKYNIKLSAWETLKDGNKGVYR